MSLIHREAVDCQLSTLPHRALLDSVFRCISTQFSGGFWLRKADFPETSVSMDLSDRSKFKKSLMDGKRLLKNFKSGCLLPNRRSLA